MTPKARLVEKRIERFVKIFLAFFEHDKLYAASLGDKLSVQIRTIQRRMQPKRRYSTGWTSTTSRAHP